LKSTRLGLGLELARGVEREWNWSASRKVRFGRVRFRNRAERPPTRTGLRSIAS
jgi:hypothetical protein